MLIGVLHCRCSGYLLECWLPPCPPSVPLCVWPWLRITLPWEQRTTNASFFPLSIWKHECEYGEERCKWLKLNGFLKICFRVFPFTRITSHKTYNSSRGSWVLKCHFVCSGIQVNVPQATLRGQNGPITSCTFNADASRIATASRDAVRHPVLYMEIMSLFWRLSEHFMILWYHYCKSVYVQGVKILDCLSIVPFTEV